MAAQLSIALLDRRQRHLTSAQRSSLMVLTIHRDARTRWHLLVARSTTPTSSIPMTPQNSTVMSIRRTSQLRLRLTKERPEPTATLQYPTVLHVVRPRMTSPNLVAGTTGNRRALSPALARRLRQARVPLAPLPQASYMITHLVLSDRPPQAHHSPRDLMVRVVLTTPLPAALMVHQRLQVQPAMRLPLQVRHIRMVLSRAQAMMAQKGQPRAIPMTSLSPLAQPVMGSRPPVTDHLGHSLRRPGRRQLPLARQFPPQLDLSHRLPPRPRVM